MEIMASTSNAEKLVKIARIVYQLCDYTDFRADFLKTRICGKWSVFANQVTFIGYFFISESRNVLITNCTCEIGLVRMAL